MRERQNVSINRLTGEVSSTTELLPDASVAERFAAMKAQGELAMIGKGPVEARWASVLCDGCGRRAPVDFDHPELPDGWVTREAGEFCPECR